MTREINIRLNANCAKAVHTGHKFVSGDKGIVFRIAVESMDTVGTTAKIVFKRSNGTSVEADITEENGIYCYTTLGNEFAVVGPVTADVKFYEGEKRLSTCTFVFDVISDTMDGIGAGTGGYSDTLERMKESMEQTESEMLEVKRDMEAYAEAFLGAYPFNPCGAYSETESYTVRDMVTHNDVAWVCYKDCTGATPAMDSDCWMPLAIKVVDAETLDGHGAEYFAPLSVLANYFKNTGGTIADKNAVPLIISNTTEGATQVRIAMQAGGINLGYFAFNGVDIPVVVLTGGFIKKLIHESNISDYALSNTGGTVNGNVTVKADDTSQRIHALQNSVRRVFQTIGTSGNYNLYDGTNNKAIIVSTADGTNTFNGTLSTKPTGTYTGNGDATQRIIATGSIGNVFVVRQQNTTNFAIVTASGYIGKLSDTVVCGVDVYANVNLIIQSASKLFNTNGAVYEYHSL